MDEQRLHRLVIASLAVELVTVVLVIVWCGAWSGLLITALVLAIDAISFAAGYTKARLDLVQRFREAFREL